MMTMMRAMVKMMKTVSVLRPIFLVFVATSTTSTALPGPHLAFHDVPLPARCRRLFSQEGQELV